MYHEFLRAPALSMGLYVLAPGSTDPQRPHDEDEVYHVVSGRGPKRERDGTRALYSGSIVYVAASAAPLSQH
ncbi:MAG: hypothetical protein R2838_23685 [Caldilineaceae bacterium]